MQNKTRTINKPLALNRRYNFMTHVTLASAGISCHRVSVCLS